MEDDKLLNQIELFEKNALINITDKQFLILTGFMSENKPEIVKCFIDGEMKKVSDFRFMSTESTFVTNNLVTMSTNFYINNKKRAILIIGYSTKTLLAKYNLIGQSYSCPNDLEHYSYTVNKVVLHITDFIELEGNEITNNKRGLLNEKTKRNN